MINFSAIKRTYHSFYLGNERTDFRKLFYFFLFNFKWEINFDIAAKEDIVYNSKRTTHLIRQNFEIRNRKQF